VIEPYRQQFEGSCVNHYAIRHFSDFSNDQFGVTVSAVDSALVQYDRPRSYPSLKGELYHETSREYPKHSRMYLYLMNNVFKTNVRADQQGPHTYRYSMRSHAGDWLKGQASQFGWDVHNPLMGRVIEGRQEGTLPADEKSFVSIEPANIVCTTIKPAEFNGSGLVLRLVETSGKKTQAVVSLPFLDGIESANECNLVEVDKPVQLAVKNGQSIRVEIPPFGVKTVRIHPKTPGQPLAVEKVSAKPVSDMEIALSWPVDEKAMKNISHFNVYRGEAPDFKPTLLHLVARPVQPSCVDRPVLHYGGWINNQLDPDTAYYYRVAAVDRWNSEGPLSDAVSAKTMKSQETNMVPLQVERLSAIHVSPISDDNSVALLFRTSCESDIEKYEIHRSTTAGFIPSEATRIGEVHSDTIIPGEDSYGHTPIDYPIKDFDHAMFDDQTVKPGTTYYYRVCAVDEAGQHGAFSAEASAKTGVEDSL
jgi:fibronectin type 3 domain-containing protein